MASQRTFIAVESSAAVASRAAALIERLRAADAKVSWVHPDKMHWTLKFLGDVELTKTADICRRVAEAVAGFAPFEMEVCGAGAFPSTTRPRTIWLGAGEGQEHMVALNEAIEATLDEMGFARERRRYTPHLTLGRVRGQQNLQQLGERISDRASFQAGRMEVDEVLVLASHLEPKGPQYDVLGRAPLGGTSTG